MDTAKVVRGVPKEEEKIHSEAVPFTYPETA